MYKKTTLYPNYVTESEKCMDFLSNYTDRYDQDRPKYMEQLQSIANRDSRVLEIALDDVEQHFSSNPEFITSITHNTRRYQQLFYKAADSIMPAPTKSLEGKSDIYDILNTHRTERLTSQQSNDQLPHELKRRYELHIIPRTLDKPLKLRGIKAKHVGSLVSVKGIVTRTTDVLPLVKVVTYLCDACGCESYQTVDDRTFNPLSQCPSASCIKNDIKGKLHQLTRGSKFVRYQEIKLQELHTEVPIGHIPRTITLRSYGELTRQCKPGDLITVSGIFLPIKYEGYRAVRAGLTADTYIEVTHIVPAKQSYSEYTLTPELEAEVEQKSQDKDIYSQLAQSIAPEIYGHEDIKKALVLLLVSGVNRHMEDGMKIRGDINVLLMGDPGVAKSQLLKHITTIAPRAVYTTGKGSSGVGLTAAVLRDPTTGEMTLEGGALVLADMGICCIDEFDKMEDADRTAIHEVMEQQTVSIAKAGIVTTLNARTSILAAANPVYGRWKLSETPETNLGLPTALLSRFDLTFIILDKPNEANDEALARHITHVHRENTHPPLDFTPFSSSFLRAYVAKARSFTPYIPNDKELLDFIVGSYVGLRKEDETEETLPSQKHRYQQRHNNNNRQRFCTARSLLSILRLSQGLARLHMRSIVTREDVEEAIRLLYVSKNTALEDDEKIVRLDPITRVFNVIKNYCQENKTKTISRADLRGRLFAKNLSEKNLEDTLIQYEELDILKVSRDRQTITIISGN